MKLFIPPQLKHLLPALLLFILLFTLVKRLAVPDTFGDLGHYRAASLEDNADKELLYAGHESCTECHADIAESKDFDLHSGVACESCHGPGMAHAVDPESADISMPVGREFCGHCHNQIMGGSRAFIAQVDITEHYVEKKNCIDCHNPHAPWELKE